MCMDRYHITIMHPCVISALTNYLRPLGLMYRFAELLNDVSAKDIKAVLLKRNQTIFTIKSRPFAYVHGGFYSCTESTAAITCSGWLIQ